MVKYLLLFMKCLQNIFLYFSVVSGSSDKKLYLGEIEWVYMTTRISLSDQQWYNKVQISTCWMKAAYIIRQGSCKDSIMNTSFLYTARQCIGSVGCFVLTYVTNKFLSQTCIHIWKDKYF